MARSSKSSNLLKSWPLSSLGQPLNEYRRERIENVYVTLQQQKRFSPPVSIPLPPLPSSLGKGSKCSIGTFPVASNHSISTKQKKRCKPSTEPIYSKLNDDSKKKLIQRSSSNFPSASNSASSTSTTIVPWFRNMKVFKKVQQKIGFGNPADKHSSKVPPPLLFHSIHGENIQITNGGTVARRIHSFCKAIVFSNRPLRINERVCLKLIDISPNWSGVIRFGFTSHDPSTLRSSLPKYVCPDLTSRVGFWAKAFYDHLIQKDTVLFYYVTNSGDIKFGINGEELGTFFKDVDTRGPLWAVLDIYGNTTAVEIIDSRNYLNNSRNSVTSLNAGAHEVSANLGALSLNSSSSLSEPEILPVQCYPDIQLYGITFHSTCGKNVILGRHKFSGSRLMDEYTNGYLFTSRALKLNETIVIQIQKTEPRYTGSLAFGLTSCDPNLLKSEELPDDSYLLQDRSEYWVVQKNIGSNAKPRDELAITLCSSGEVKMSKNGERSSVLMHVDTSIPLWCFFDLYGSTEKISVAGTKLSDVNTINQTTSSSGEKREIGASSIFRPSAPFHTLLETGISSSQQNNECKSSLGATISSENSSVVGVDSKINGQLDEMGNWSIECVACCENPVNCVFYQCGHLTMCYECAIDYWQNRKRKRCPICRSLITDVIKIFKS